MPANPLHVFLMYSPSMRINLRPLDAAPRSATPVTATSCPMAPALAPALAFACANSSTGGPFLLFPEPPGDKTTMLPQPLFRQLKSNRNKPISSSLIYRIFKVLRTCRGGFIADKPGASKNVRDIRSFDSHSIQMRIFESRWILQPIPQHPVKPGVRVGAWLS